MKNLYIVLFSSSRYQKKQDKETLIKDVNMMPESAMEAWRDDYADMRRYLLEEGICGGIWVGISQISRYFKIPPKIPPLSIWRQLRN